MRVANAMGGGGYRKDDIIQLQYLEEVVTPFYNESEIKTASSRVLELTIDPSEIYNVFPFYLDKTYIAWLNGNKLITFTSDGEKVEEKVCGSSSDINTFFDVQNNMIAFRTDDYYHLYNFSTGELHYLFPTKKSYFNSHMFTDVISQMAYPSRNSTDFVRGWYTFTADSVSGYNVTETLEADPIIERGSYFAFGLFGDYVMWWCNKHDYPAKYAYVFPKNSGTLTKKILTTDLTFLHFNGATSFSYVNTPTRTLFWGYNSSLDKRAPGGQYNQFLYSYDPITNACSMLNRATGFSSIGRIYYIPSTGRYWSVCMEVNADAKSKYYLVEMDSNYNIVKKWKRTDELTDGFYQVSDMRKMILFPDHTLIMPGSTAINQYTNRLTFQYAGKKAYKVLEVER